MMRLGACLAIGLAMLATACSPTQPAESTTTMAELPAVIPSIWDRERPATDVILELHQGGGHTQASDSARRIPLLTLYADGTLVGMARLEGVSPKLVPLNRVTLSSEERAQIERLVGEIGLHEIDEEFDTSLSGQVFDAATVSAVYTDPNGTQHTYGAYGLTPGAIDEDSSKTTALGELLAAFGSLSWQRDGNPVPTTRIQLFLFPGSLGSGEPVAWPLQVSPDDFGSFGPGDSTCLHLSGVAATSEGEVLASTKLRAAFMHGERSHYVVAKHLFPHEAACGPEIDSLDS